jgi:hypothetical protein
MTVLDTVTRFHAKVAEIESHIGNAFTMNSDNHYLFEKPFRSFVVEACLVKLYIAWEEFLEDCFTCYSMAQTSLSGMRYVRYMTPIDISHAKNMAKGTQKFVEWGNTTIVLTLCNLCFNDGQPFKSVIGSINQDLSDLRVIRNAAAHLSSTTKAAFDAVAVKMLGFSATGIDVPDLLLSVHPKGSANQTVLMRYIQILDAAITAIAR